MTASERTFNTNLLPSNVQEIIYDLSKTATKIAVQNFEWRFITLVYFNTTLWFGAEVFVQSYEKAIVIGSGTFYPKFVENTRQYVLFVNSVTNIVHTLDWMQIHEFDNTGKYIIICQSQHAHECDEVVAMQTLWEHKITNVILLKSVENVTTGFTYFPLSNNACTYDKPVRLVNLTCLDALDFQEPCNLFPLKLSNFNTCPLIVSTFIHEPYMNIENGIPSGSDGDLLRLVAEKLNGNLSVMTPRKGDGWGKLEENGTWVGSLADIYYNYANFSMTSAAVTFTRFLYFQMSVEYHSVNIVWITHPAKKIPASLKLTYPFQRVAQIALIFSFASVVVCSLIIRSRFCYRISHKIKLERPRNSLVFYSWMICMGLGLPTTKLPTKTAFLYIVLLWIWYCFLVRTFYQVFLISAMKANYYYQEFESIEDAIDAGYPFGGGIALKDYFIDYPFVYNHWTDVSPQDILPILRNVSKGMEFVLATKIETAQLIIWKEKLKFHILPQRVNTCPIVVFFKKFSPLADPVNSVLVRFIESGISDKIYKNYAGTKVPSNIGKSIESIKLVHYAGCYAVLITGWIVSFLLFVAENLFDKICRQQRERVCKT